MNNGIVCVHVNDYTVRKLKFNVDNSYTQLRLSVATVVSPPIPSSSYKLSKQGLAP